MLVDRQGSPPVATRISAHDSVEEVGVAAVVATSAIPAHAVLALGLGMFDDGALPAEILCQGYGVCNGR